MTTVGVIGVGRIMRHLVPGLMRAERKPRLLLSPRGAAVSAELAARFGLEIAPDNRAVIERSCIVLVAVRPFQVAEALDGLPWRAEQTVVSLCAGIAIPDLAQSLAPARVVRAMPVTAAGLGESPTCVFPADPAVDALLAPAGPVIPLARETDFEAASVIACYYTWVQRLIAETAQWLAREGLDEPTARRLAAAMTRAGAATVLGRTETSLEGLVAELCLPGSYSLQGLEVLEARDAFGPWQAASEAVLARMRGRRG